MKYITSPYEKPRARAVILAGMTLFSVWLTLVLVCVNAVMPITHADAPQASLLAPYVVYEIPSLNPNISEREQNILLIKKIWGKDSKLGLEIARCESGYRTAGKHVANKDRSVDQGVFSINSIHGMPEMEVAVANISYAYIMYLEQGVSPWVSSESCWK